MKYPSTTTVLYYHHLEVMLNIYFSRFIKSPFTIYFAISRSNLGPVISEIEIVFINY